MIQFQDLPTKINPIAVSFNGFDLRWYSISYLLVFITVVILISFRIKKNDAQKYFNLNLSFDSLLEILTWLFFGAVLGGRIFHIFLNLNFYFQNPIQTFSPFQNSQFVGLYGMSFFGGLIGALLTGYWLCRKKKISFTSLINFLLPAFPLGYFWGRIGNFLNGELYGKKTDLPWAMNFPTDPENLPRHPSQLYEAFLEGIVIFLILWSIRNHPKLKNQILPLFLILYGIIRFVMEFFRENFDGTYLAGLLTQGQLLSIVTLLFGLFILGYRYENTGSGNFLR